jgi:hypothetical protein
MRNDGVMSAKAQLMEAVARVPETVALEILRRIQPLLEPVAGEGGEIGGQDFFQSYWSQLYGTLEEADWVEPQDLPFEQRDSW